MSSKKILRKLFITSDESSYHFCHTAVQKYKNIRKNIKYRNKKIQENTMKNIADEIINKNIKLLRKLKLENLENK